MQKLPERCTMPFPLISNDTLSPVMKFKSRGDCNNFCCLDKLHSIFSCPSHSRMTLSTSESKIKEEIQTFQETTDPKKITQYKSWCEHLQ